jgi:hypothetical protein
LVYLCHGQLFKRTLLKSQVQWGFHEDLLAIKCSKMRITEGGAT